MHAGFPLDSAAVLLIEVEGLREAVEAQASADRGGLRLCTARGKCARARDAARARTAVEGPQECLWRDRAALAIVLRAGRRDSAHAN